MNKLTEVGFTTFVLEHKWLLVESPECGPRCKRKAIYLTPMGNMVTIWVDKSGDIVKVLA